MMGICLLPLPLGPIGYADLDATVTDANYTIVMKHMFHIR